MTTHRGGAGGAARRIFEAQQAIGLNVHGFSRDIDQSAYPGWDRLTWPKGPAFASHWQRLWLSLAKKGKPRSIEPLTLAVRPGPTPLPPHVTDCDVLHLHWLGGPWIDYPSFTESIPRDLPVVWTLHDLNGLMALSHYFEDAGRVVAEPAVEDYWINALGRGLVASSWRAKESLVRERRITFAPVAQWQVPVLEQSPLGRLAAGRELIRYPFAFDPEARPIPRRDARRELGLEPDATYVLLGAETLTNPRKGFHHAFAALRQGVGRDIRVITFGNDVPADRAAALIDRSFGYIDGRDKLNMIYAAADVFVTPALQESCSQTGLESLAVGTPVVCFAQTGSTEYVIDGINGAAAPQKTTESLRLALSEVLRKPEVLDQKRVWRHFAEELWPQRFYPETQARRHEALYQSLRDSRPAER